MTVAAVTTSYKWAAVNENWAPLSGVEVEALNLTTLKPDDIQRTGLDGIVTFTGLPAGPHIPRVRARRVSTKVGGRTYTGQIRLIPVAMGNQGITKHYVVDANGMGTHTTVQAAITAAIALGANFEVVIYCNPGAYTEDLTVPFGATDGAIYLVGEGAVVCLEDGSYNSIVTIQGSAGTTTPVLEASGAGSLAVIGINFKPKLGASAETLKIATSNDLELNECKVTSWAAGFTAVVDVRCRNCIISTGGRVIDSANQIYFEHCYVSGAGLIKGNWDTLVVNECTLKGTAPAGEYWIHEDTLVISRALYVTKCISSAGGGSGVIKFGDQSAISNDCIIAHNKITVGGGQEGIHIVELVGAAITDNIIEGASNADGSTAIVLGAGVGGACRAAVVAHNSIRTIQNGITVGASATDGTCVIGPNAYYDVGTDTSGVPAAEDYQLSLATASCALLDGTIHTDTVAQAVTAGSMIIANDTPAWDELAISVPAANVRNVLGIDNGETTPSWKTALDATNPADIAAAASPGTSLVFARRDHVHNHPDLGDLHTGYLLADGSRGLSSNWAPGAHDIGDYDYAAKPTVLYVGDANFYLYVLGAAPNDDPTLRFASGDYIQFDRSADELDFVIASGTVVRVSAAGLLTNTITEIGANQGVTIEGNLLKDSYISPASDANFTLSIVSSNPRLTVDSGDYLEYNRAGNYFYTNQALEVAGFGAFAGANLDTDFALYIKPTFTQTASSTWTRGIYSWVLADPAGASASEFQGIRALVQSDAGCAQNFTATQGLVGLSFAAQHLGSGLATGVYGCNFYADIGGSGNVTVGAGFRMRGRTLGGSSGKFVTYYNLYIDTFSAAGSGAVDNLYGIYIADLSQGTSLNYGLYFAGTSGLARQGIWWNGDTNLYRSAANVLQTDDAFVAGGAITAGGVVTGTQMQTGNATGMKLCAYAATYGIGLQASLMEFIVPAAARDFRWGYGTSGSLTECMHLDTPLKRLKVVGDLSS